MTEKSAPLKHKKLNCVCICYVVSDDCGCICSQLLSKPLVNNEQVVDNILLPEIRCHTIVGSAKKEFYNPGCDSLWG